MDELGSVMRAKKENGMISRTLTISIDRPPQDVYDFVSDPRTGPQWATSFVRSVKNIGGEWVFTRRELGRTAEGDVRIRFCTRNEFGVLDHYVTPAPGVDIYVPMRVVENGSGSEVVFTLFQQAGMSDSDFARDIGWVERDLKTLKKVLETLADA